MVSKPLRITKKVEESEIDPWKMFLNAMRSPVTRDRYSTRVAKFFEFIKIPRRTLDQKGKNFARKGKNDADWAFSNILKFIYYQKERVEKKEISVFYPNKIGSVINGKVTRNTLQTIIENLSLEEFNRSSKTVTNIGLQPNEYVTPA